MIDDVRAFSVHVSHLSLKPTKPLHSGVFDENDNRTFEEEEFVEMLLALFRGMAAMLLGPVKAQKMALFPPCSAGNSESQVKTQEQFSA